MARESDDLTSSEGQHSAIRVKSSPSVCTHCGSDTRDSGDGHLCSHTHRLPLPMGARATELAERIARMTGLKYLGVLGLNRPGSVTLRFPSGLDLPLDPPWPEDELDAIGRAVGVYIVPSSRLMGVRGDRGDVLMTYVDIQRYRYREVFRYLTGTVLD